MFKQLKQRFNLKEFTLMGPTAHKAGFTLIELIVAMAVIAILVLLAMPRFSGYARQAKITQAQHDAKVIENSMEEYLINNAEFDDSLGAPVENEMLQGIADRKNLVHTENEALVETVDSVEYFHLPEEYIRTVLKIKKPSRDRAFASKDGHVLIDLEGGELFLVGGGSFTPSEEEETATGNCPTEETPADHFTYVYIWENTEVQITGFSTEGENATVIRFPAEIDGLPVTSIGESAFDHEGITAVCFPEGISTIKTQAFYGNHLTEVDLRSISSIGGSAFGNNEIAALSIPDSVIDLGPRAFELNASLEQVVLNGNISSVGHSPFGGAKLGASGVVIGVAVTEIPANIFINAGISAVNIPEGITSIGDFAFNTNEIAAVNIPGAVVSIGQRAFESNASLEQVVLNGNIDSVGHLPFGGANLGDTGVVLGAVVTKIPDNIFSNAGVSAVYLPERITSIGDFAFNNNDIITLNIPGAVVNIGQKAFESNETLEQVVLNGNISSAGYGPFEGAKLGADGLVFTDAVTVIPTFLFLNAGLTAVDIPDRVTSIGMYAFYNNKIVTLRLPSELDSLGQGAFAENSLLEQVVLNGNISSSGYAPFEGANLGDAGIVLTDVVTEIPGTIFMNAGVTAVLLPEGITSIGMYAFYNNRISSLIIPSSMNHIGGNAFERNSILQGQAVVRNNLVNIESSAFSNNGADGMTTITPIFIQE